jgi:hypothetical protein
MEAHEIEIMFKKLSTIKQNIANCYGLHEEHEKFLRSEDFSDMEERKDIVFPKIEKKTSLRKNESMQLLPIKKKTTLNVKEQVEFKQKEEAKISRKNSINNFEGKSEILSPSPNTSQILEQKNKDLTEKRPQNKKKESLLKLYNHDHDFVEKIKKIKKVEIKKDEIPVEQYQNKIFDLMQGRMCRESMKDMQKGFKNILSISNGKHKVKKTKWSEVAKRIQYSIPDYLAEKFNQL